MNAVVLLALFCLFAAVQARSTSLQVSNRAAELGENPWVVHLRIATNSGYLSTCGASLLDPNTVLTAASCVNGIRFSWVRFGLVNTLTPQLVLEAASSSLHPDFNAASLANNIAVVRFARFVEYTSNIQPIAISESTATEGIFCGFGATEEDAPGEVLQCLELELVLEGEDFSASGEIATFDVGAALVADGHQIGILSSISDGTAYFLNAGRYAEWLSTFTGANVFGQSHSEVIVVN